MPQTHQWLATIMDHAIRQGFLEDWVMNWIKPIHNGVKTLAPNYRTIMVSLVMATLYGTIMEQNISSWAEHHQKTSTCQLGFRPKRSIVDHLVTLQGESIYIYELLEIL